MSGVSARSSAGARACSRTCSPPAASTSASATSWPRDRPSSIAAFPSSPRTSGAITAGACTSTSAMDAPRCGPSRRGTVSSSASASTAEGGALRSVLVVDDSAFMRRLISQIIEESGEFRVAATARNGLDALHKVHALNPDLVTMDVDMPELDGIQALGYIMSEAPRPVVMLSAATTHSGHDATLRALELGAVDFVRKPSGPISLDLARVTERLLGALRAAAQPNVRGVRMLAVTRLPVRGTPAKPSLSIQSTESRVTPAGAGARGASADASSTGGARSL